MSIHKASFYRMANVTNVLLNIAWLLRSTVDHIYFRWAIKNVERVQRQILFGYISKNLDTEFGRKHAFGKIKSVAEYQQKVPLSIFEDYLEDIEAIKRGENSVLTSSKVFLLEPTSGSVSASKYIPYNNDLKKEFQRAISPWIFNLFTHRTKLIFGRAYWSISPKTSVSPESTNLKVGFESDTEYLQPAFKFLFNKMLAVPNEVARLEYIDNYRYVTLLFLLKAHDLVLISIWSPTFLSLLLDPLDQWLVKLIADIRNGTISPPMPLDSSLRQSLSQYMFKDTKRATELEIIRERLAREKSSLLYEMIWPRLQLISCWDDGGSTYYADKLRNMFPHAEIQGKGLIATEGIISFPLVQKGCILAITSHFFEFLKLDKDRDKSETKLAHQLEQGKRYAVVITTGGGLYRYQLKDIVEVLGFAKQCPLIKFIGKEDKVLDFFGEKVSESYVSVIVKKILLPHISKITFFILAPTNINSKISYTLFLEFSHDDIPNKSLLGNLKTSLEQELLKNYHYRHCRKLGQLLDAKLFIIRIGKNGNAQETYTKKYLGEGKKLGDIKPPVLDQWTHWGEYFDGKFV